MQVPNLENLFRYCLTVHLLNDITETLSSAALVLPAESTSLSLTQTLDFHSNLLFL
jgi:hypothetical protein